MADTTERRSIRYGVGRGGENEPGLITDHITGLIVARSSEMALKYVIEMANLANEAWTGQKQEGKPVLEDLSKPAEDFHG